MARKNRRAAGRSSPYTGGGYRTLADVVDPNVPVVQPIDARHDRQPLVEPEPGWLTLGVACRKTGLDSGVLKDAMFGKHDTVKGAIPLPFVFTTQGKRIKPDDLTAWIKKREAAQ